MLQHVTAVCSSLVSRIRHWRRPGPSPQDQSEASESLLGKQGHSNVNVQSQHQDMVSRNLWHMVVLVVGVTIGILLQSYATVLSFERSSKLVQVMGYEGTF